MTGTSKPVDQLEAHLGSEDIPGNPMSFASAVAYDEQEAYPLLSCEALDSWGFHRYFVPVNHGGLLSSYEDLMMLWRSVARRDLTTAVAQVITFIGASPVWVSGNDEQKRLTAELILSKEQMAFALTERQHGSDLLANTCFAQVAEGGYRISGEKWLIGNGNRSRAFTIFCRTAASGGPGGYSMFLVDKQQLAPGELRPLPHEPTMGLRGMDLSGMTLNAAAVSKGALIGEENRGLECLLKAQQLARLAISNLAHGAADTALRLGATFALERKLYGDPIINLPYVRKRLMRSFLVVYASDCLLRATARGVHVAPEQLSLWSAVVKCVVPTLINEAFGDLAMVLGARFFLRSEFQNGMFQKALRDQMVLGVVEGSTAVNLKAIAAQLPSVARTALMGDTLTGASERAERLERVFCASSDSPSSDMDLLAVMNCGREDMTQSLLCTHYCVVGALESGNAPRELIDLVLALRHQLHTLFKQVVELVGQGGVHAGHRGLEAFSERFGVLHLAASCLHSYMRQGPRYETSDSWVSGCLSLLLSRVGCAVWEPDELVERQILNELVEKVTRRELFSRLGVQLPKTIGRSQR